MRRIEREQQHVDQEKYKNEFKKDIGVTINIDGEWRLAQIVSFEPDFSVDPHIPIVNVKWLERVPSGAGATQFVERRLAIIDPLVSKKDVEGLDSEFVAMRVDDIHHVEAPLMQTWLGGEVVKIADSGVGGTFEISEPKITKEGEIELSIKSPDGKIHTGVPYEFAKKWKRTLELEFKVREELKNLVSTIIGDKRKKLHDRRIDLEIKLSGVYKHLPEVDKMQDADSKSVHNIIGEIEKLHKEAEEEIKNIEKEIREIVLPPAEGELTFTDFSRESKADREARIKLEKAQKEKDKKQTEALEKNIERKKQKLLDDIEKEEMDDLKKYNDKLLVEFDTPNGAGGKWDADTNTKKGKRPTFTNKTELPKKEATVFVRKRADADVLAIGELIQELEKKEDGKKTDVQKELLKFVEKRRKELASVDIVGDIENGDYVKKGDLLSDYSRANAQALRDVLESWKKDYVEPAEPASTKEGQFDVDVEYEKVKNVLLELKQKLSSDGKAPEKTDLKKIYDKVVEGVHSIDNDFLITVVGRQEEANKDRLVELNKLRVEVQKLKKDLENIEFTEASTASQKEIKDHKKKLDENTPEQKFETQAVDIPDHKLKKMLEGQPERMYKVMDMIMRGAVTRGEGNETIVNPGVLQQMKDLFPANVTSDEHTPLRDFGIKNWSKFKELWDSTLADRAVKMLDRVVAQTLERKIAENTKWYEKLNALKGRIIGRAAANAALLSGGALLTSELVGHITDWADASVKTAQAVKDTSVGASGLLSGATKWGIFKWLNKNGAQEKTQASLDQLHDKKKGDIIKELLGDIFTVVKSGDTTTYSFKNGVDNLSGVGAFSRMVSQDIRNNTAGQEIFKFEDKEVNLSGNDLIEFRRYMASSETRDVDAEMQYKLAFAFVKMKERGDTMMSESTVIKQKIGLMDKFVSNMSGAQSLKGAMATNLALSSLFMISGTVRGVFGATMGGHLGWKLGESLFYSNERGKNVERMKEKMKFVATQIDELRRGDIDPKNKERLKQEIIGLKRVLHGTASPEDMSAFIYRVERKGKDKDNKDLPPEVRIDAELLGQIEPLVYEADRHDLFLEQKADKAKLDKVLEAMLKKGNAIEQQQQDAHSTWKAIKKGAFKVGMGGVGAMAGWVMFKYGGPAIAQAARKGFSMAGDATVWTGKQIAFIGDSVSHQLGITNSGELFSDAKTGMFPTESTFERLAHIPEVAAKATAGANALASGSGSGSGSETGGGTQDVLDNNGHTRSPRGSDTSLESAPRRDLASESDIHRESKVGDYEFKRGNGWLHGARGIEKDFLSEGNPERGKVLDAIKNKHPEWSKHFGNDKKLLSLWKTEQMNNDEFFIKKEGQVFGKTIHAGAKLHFIYDKGGYPHMTLDPAKYGVAVEGNMDHVSDHGLKFKARVVPQENLKNSSTLEIVHDDGVSSDDVVRKGFASQKYIHIEPNMVEGIIENIHKIKGNADVWDVEVLSSNKALVKFSDGTTYEVVKARGDSPEFRGKYIPDTRLQTNVNRLLQVLPKGEDTTRLSQADRIITDLQKKYDHVEINNAKMDENNKLILEMSYHQKEGDLIHSGNRTEKMVIQDVVRSSQRNIPMTNIGGTIHDMFMRPGEKITSVEGVSGGLDASTRLIPSAKNLGAKVSPDRSGVFADEFLERDGVGRGVDSSTDKINAPAEQTQTSSGQNVEQTVSDSPDASTENLAQWNSWLDSYKDTLAVNLDQYGTVVKEMAEAVLQKVNASPETLSLQAKMILNSYEDPIKMIRSLSDVFANDGSFSNLGLEEKLFIGGTHVQDPTEFMKVKVLLQDGTGYAGDAYVPINNGIPASKFAAIEFDDDRGYRFFSSKESTYGVDVDNSGEPVLMEYTDNPDDGTTQVSPVLLANK